MASNDCREETRLSEFRERRATTFEFRREDMSGLWRNGKLCAERWCAGRSGFDLAPSLATALGKKTRTPRPEEVRVIAPLPVIFQPLDHAIAMRIEKAVSSYCGYFF